MADYGPVEEATRKQLRALGARQVVPALVENVLKVARTLDATSAARDTAALSAQHAQRMREIVEAVKAHGAPASVDPVEQATEARERRLRAVE